MMRALVYERYGPPEQVMRLEQVPRPQPDPGQVLVRVAACALNAWDWDHATGQTLVRLGAPFRPAHRILGADIAGTVVALGAGVSGFAEGQRVCGDLSDGRWGGLAEYAVADAAALTTMPDDMDFISAAALPQAGCLALQALRKRAVRPGDAVLINGAGGGVGTFAVQLAKATGARVTAVDSADKRDALLALGADDFIDYRQADYWAQGAQYDLIVDMVARRGPRDYAPALREGGTFVMVGGTAGAILRCAMFGTSAGKARGQRLDLLVYRVSAADVAEVAARTRPVIDSVLPLERGAEALRKLGASRVVGKVVVRVEG